MFYMIIDNIGAQLRLLNPCKTNCSIIQRAVALDLKRKLNSRNGEDIQHRNTNRNRT